MSAPAELGAQVRTGVRWSAVAFYAGIVVRLAASVVLARLLAPADFGLMAMAMACVGVLTMVQESGLSTALVQHRGELRPAAGAVLVMTSAGGLALGVGLWIAAPWIAHALAQPRLTDVIRGLALICPIRGTAHAPRALLQRAMAFRTLAAVEFLAVGVYTVAGIALAARGNAVWSLVGAQVGSEVALAIGTWIACTERPRPVWPSRRGPLRDLVGFGRHVVAANLLGLLHYQLPSLVVGGTLGAEILGFYWMAFRWASMPIQGITHVAGRVAYPALARLREDGGAAAFRGAYLRVLRSILAVAAPAAVGLGCCADALVTTLYDARWQPAIATLQILAGFGLLHAIAATTGEVFKAAGVPRFVALYAALYDALLALGLWQLGAHWGLAGIAWATVLAPGVVMVVSLATVGRLIGLPTRPLLRAASTPVVASAAMALAMLAVRHVAPAGVADLALRLAVGVATYVGVALVREPELLAELAALAGVRLRATTPRRRLGLARATAVLLAAALVGEVGLRVAHRGVSAATFGPWQERRAWERLRALGPDGAPWPVAGGVARWRLQPWDRPVEYRLDDAGFRVAALSADGGAGRRTCRVLVAGESTAFGYGVAAEDALPARLGGALADAGVPARVRNAGLCASNVAQQEPWLHATLRQARPAVAVLVVSPWSLRLDREPPPADAHLADKLWRVAEPRLAALARWSALGERVTALGLRLVPSWLGWPPAGTVAWELAPLAEPRDAFDARWRRVAPALDALVDETRAAHARPLVVFVPLDVQVSRARNALYRTRALPYRTDGFVDRDYSADRRYQDALAAWAAARGVAYADATPWLRADAEHVFLPDDYHLGPVGHARLAEALVPAVARACAAGDTPPVRLAGRAPTGPGTPAAAGDRHRKQQEGPSHER